MNKPMNEKVWARFQRMCEVIDQPYALNYEAADEGFWYLIHEPIAESYAIARKHSSMGKILAGPFGVDEFLRAANLAEANILARADQEFPSITKKLNVLLAELCQVINQDYATTNRHKGPGYWYLGEENGRYAILETTIVLASPRSVTGWMQRYDFEEAIAIARTVVTEYNHNLQCGRDA